jgi:hypothetical protein
MKGIISGDVIVLAQSISSAAPIVASITIATTV